MSPPLRAVFIAASGLVGCMFYLFGERLTWAVWNKHVRFEEKGDKTRAKVATD